MYKINNLSCRFYSEVYKHYVYTGILIAVHSETIHLPQSCPVATLPGMSVFMQNTLDLLVLDVRQMLSVLALVLAGGTGYGECFVHAKWILLYDVPP